IREHPVLLNRAPALHRLGIQAFEPVLIEGKAIQLHPLVCAAFNADFDGDQMAVHLPLSAEAQAEARVLMLSSNNMLSPAHGKPLVTPTQDMIIGAFYITSEVEGAKGEGMTLRRIDQVERAVESGALDIHAKITYRGSEYPELVKTPANGSAAEYHTTTAGRILLNECLPEGYPYVNKPVRKREMTDLVDHLAVEFPKAKAAASLDALKGLCFNWAMRSGLTVSIDDVRTPSNKYDILDRHEDEADKVEKQFRRGIITDGERKQKE
ncbi:MAG: DNA-directed RNA polymerase subunit beta', partial [Microthrixaceae bacterium]|nr:DNA-directed RNA polymerase subunit beta' [Microthrixaceae bacterium]